MCAWLVELPVTEVCSKGVFDVLGGCLGCLGSCSDSFLESFNLRRVTDSFLKGLEFLLILGQLDEYGEYCMKSYTDCL